MYVLSPSCSSSASLLSFHCLLTVLYFGFCSCRGDIRHWRHIMGPYLLPTFSALGLHPESRQSLCDTDVFIDLFRFSFFTPLLFYFQLFGLCWQQFQHLFLPETSASVVSSQHTFIKRSRKQQLGLVQEKSIIHLVKAAKFISLLFFPTGEFYFYKEPTFIVQNKDFGI